MVSLQPKSKKKSDMKIVILDGYTANPGDLSWKELEELGTLTVYDRTRPEETVARAADAEIVLTNKEGCRCRNRTDQQGRYQSGGDGSAASTEIYRCTGHRL